MHDHVPSTPCNTWHQHMHNHAYRRHISVWITASLSMLPCVVTPSTQQQTSTGMLTSMRKPAALALPTRQSSIQLYVHQTRWPSIKCLRTTGKHQNFESPVRGSLRHARTMCSHSCRHCCAGLAQARRRKWWLNTTAARPAAATTHLNTMPKTEHSPYLAVCL